MWQLVLLIDNWVLVYNERIPKTTFWFPAAHRHDLLDWFQMSGGACPDEWLWHLDSVLRGRRPSTDPLVSLGEVEADTTALKLRKNFWNPVIYMHMHTETQIGAWSTSSVRVGWQTLRYAKWMLIMERHRGQTFIISKLITAIFLIFVTQMDTLLEVIDCL